jgi:hypothetical protein
MVLRTRDIRPVARRQDTLLNCLSGLDDIGGRLVENVLTPLSVAVGLVVRPWCWATVDVRVAD